MIRMGYRLSKIYTRTGDEGTTGLGDGTRVPKDNARVAAFGDVDELNSALGVLLAHTLPEALRAPLVRIQHDLFEVGGELCIPGHHMIKPEDCERLEQLIDHFNADLPHLKEFILPGGGPAAAADGTYEMTRRRAERRGRRGGRGGAGRPRRAGGGRPGGGPAAAAGGADEGTRRRAERRGGARA